jgi:hypothetical protein
MLILVVLLIAVALVVVACTLFVLLVRWLARGKFNGRAIRNFLTVVIVFGGLIWLMVLSVRDDFSARRTEAASQPTPIAYSTQPSDSHDVAYATPPPIGAVRTTPTPLGTSTPTSQPTDSNSDTDYSEPNLLPGANFTISSDRGIPCFDSPDGVKEYMSYIYAHDTEGLDDIMSRSEMIPNESRVHVIDFHPWAHELQLRIFGADKVCFTATTAVLRYTNITHNEPY